MKWCVKQLQVCLSALSFVLMPRTRPHHLGSRRQQQDFSFFSSFFSPPLLRSLRSGWKICFSFSESVACLTSVSFPFSLWLCPFIHYCTPRHRRRRRRHHHLFLPRFCVFRSPFVHLRVSAHTHEHMGRSANWHSAAYPPRSIVCYFLCVWSCSVSVSACRRRWFRCWGIAIKWNSAQWTPRWKSRGTLLWPRARSPFAVVVIPRTVRQLQSPWIASRVKFSSRDSRTCCGLDQSPGVCTCSARHPRVSVPYLSGTRFHRHQVRCRCDSATVAP